MLKDYMKQYNFYRHTVGMNPFQANRQVKLFYLRLAIINNTTVPELIGAAL